MTTGSVLAQFTITLSQAVSEQVAVEWHTADGTALAGVDYAAAKGTVLFAPGQTAKTVDILVHGRAVGSEDRSFFVEMLPPTNAILGASIGECIIHVDTTGSTPVTQIIVPTGPQGLQGDSAYQAWLDLGNTGTEEDFINSLKPSAEEIAEEVAPLIDVGDTVLTAEGTEGLSKPDATTVKAVARRVAYVGAARIATVVLADGDNLIAQSDLAGDTVDMGSVGLYPRIMRGASVLSPQWSVAADGRLLIKNAVAGDVLYVCQYDIASGQAVTRLAFEALRRSYAEAGYNLIGRFSNTGLPVNSVTDVVLWEPTGVAYAYSGTLPHTLTAVETPVSNPLWVSRDSNLLKHVFDGLVPYGPTDPVDWYYGGPQIRRRLVSTEDINIFIDPASGSDSASGLQSAPIKTLKEAIQRLPQQIYHKIRVYLLDGTYPADDCLRLFNYYVTARGRAGLRFVGHIARLDGETHPIYTDTNPDAVVVLGFEHMSSSIRGTEELYFAGITFKNGWYEGYDSYSLFVNCKFTGGHRSPGYNSYHAISGHSCQMDFINCDFSDLAQIGTLTNFANATFEKCTLNGLHMTSDAANPGRPFACSNRSTVYVRNSPQLLQTGPGGKSITTTGGHIFDFLFSPMGYNALRRSTPDRDESLYLLGHDGGALGSGRGAGVELNGVNHPTNPGRASVEFTGSSVNSKFRVVHDSGGAPVEVFAANRFGEATAKANLIFSSQARGASTYLQDGQATLYTNPTSGDVFIVSKLGGVMKYVRVLEFATAPILP